MLALAMDDGGARLLGQVLEQVAQGQDQAVVERIALGWAAQADQRDAAAHFQLHGILGGRGGRRAHGRLEGKLKNWLQVMFDNFMFSRTGLVFDQGKP